MHMSVLEGRAENDFNDVKSLFVLFEEGKNQVYSEVKLLQL